MAASNSPTFVAAAMRKTARCAGRVALVAAAVLVAAPAARGQSLPSFGNQTVNNRHEGFSTEVYRTNFENGLDEVFVIGPTVSLTTTPGEVLEGARSLKLEGVSAAVALRADLLRLDPQKFYAIEYRYRVVSSISTWGLFVGLSSRDAGGTPSWVALRGPIAAAGTAGFDVRGGIAGHGDSTFVFFTWGGTVILDEVRVYRQDVRVSAAGVPLLTAGFPRLANYNLLAPDGIALINNVSQEEVERIGARYDILTGTSIDPTVGALGWVRRLHGLNPALRILPYKQTFMAQFAGGIDGSGIMRAFNEGLHPEWYMLTPSGSVISEPAFPQNVQLDHTLFAPPVGGSTVNSYSTEFLARTVLPSGLWAGIHFDQPEWYINPLLGDPPPPIDLNRDGVADSTATVQTSWLLGFIDFFKGLARRVGYTQLLFGNAGHIPGNPFILPALNGWESEVVSPYTIDGQGDWNTNEASYWYRLFDNYVLATLYARAPQIVSLEFTGRGLGHPTGDVTANGYPRRTLGLEWRDFRRMRLGLTTALMGDGFFEYDIVDNTTPPLWFDEYAVDANGVATTNLSGKGYLGRPLSAATELDYAKTSLFTLDFETADVPAGVVLGAGRISTNPAEVIGGAASFVMRKDDPNDSQFIFQSNLPLVPGRTYQLMADYRILEYTPSTYRGLLGIGFPDQNGVLTPERSGSLYLPDTGGPGQQGTLRASVKVTHSDTVTLGGMPDTGAVAIDNIRLIEGTGGVWRRDFENGIALVNPTPEYQYVPQPDIAGPLQRTDVRRISGTQDPSWNSGARVDAGLWLAPADGVVLLAAPVPSPPLSAPGSVTVRVADSEATVSWSMNPQYVAGYRIAYGEAPEHLTREAASGPFAHVVLSDLLPGVTYYAEVSAFDFLGQTGPVTRVEPFTMPGTAAHRATFEVVDYTPTVVPGAVVELLGTNLAAGDYYQPGPSYPTDAAGTSVLVNGVAAPILAASPIRITFLTPWQISGERAIVSVVRDGVSSAERFVPVGAARPWILAWPEGNAAIAFHDDGGVVSAERPLAAGEGVTIVAFGLGAVAPFPDDGQTVSRPVAAIRTPAIQLGGVSATGVSVTLLSGSVATYGVHFTVPDSLGPGAHTIELTVDGVAGNSTALLLR